MSVLLAREWLCPPYDALFRAPVVLYDCSLCSAFLTHLLVRVPSDGHPSLVAEALNCSPEDQEDLDADLDRDSGQEDLADLGSRLARPEAGKEETYHRESHQVVGRAFLVVDLEEVGH